MRCIICAAEVDEARTFESVTGLDGKVVEDQVGKVKLARELEGWRHLTLTAQLPGGCRTILSGHACPAHDLDALTLREAEPATKVRP